VLGELCGDFSQEENLGKGAMLIQVPLPPDMAGKTFSQCATALAISVGMVVIGLYRKKIENPATRLSYVMTLPPRDEVLQKTDRLFCIRPMDCTV
jgi:hypothetical protein